MAMSDIKAGGAYVELMLRDKRFLAGLKSAGAKLGQFAVAAAKVGMAVGAVGFVAAIKAASDLEETMNKFNVVFGKNADAARQWSEEFAAEVGRSEQQVLDFMSSTQGLLIPLGFDQDKSKEISETLTRLAVDLASFNNTSDEEALASLKSGLLGEAEPMKKFGVIVNDTAMKMELLNQSIDPNKATDAEKTMARLAIIMRATATAQGDATRSAGSFANSLKALQGRTMDMFAAIGSALLPMVTNVVQAMTGVVNVIIASKDTIATVFATIGGAVWDTMTGIADITATVWAAVSESSSSAAALMQTSMLDSLSVISYAFTEWGQIVELALASMELRSAQWGAQLAYFFGEFAPEWLRRTGLAFVELGKLFGTVLLNMLRNLLLFFEAMANGSFEFNWAPLTDGFRSAMAELPPIAERAITPIEIAAQARLDKIAKQAVGGFAQHDQAFKQRVASWTGQQAEEAPTTYRNGLRVDDGLEHPDVPEYVAPNPATKIEAPDFDAIVKAAVGPGAAAGARAPQETFTTFSAAALAAQGQGGNGVVDATQRNTKAVQELLEATKRGFDNLSETFLKSQAIAT